MDYKKRTIKSVPYREMYTEAEAKLHGRQGINVEEEGTRVQAEIAEARVEMLISPIRIHFSVKQAQLCYQPTSAAHLLMGPAEIPTKYSQEKSY